MALAWPGDAPPGVGHVDGGLLVPGVDELEALVGQDVHRRQDVVAGQGEDLFHALGLQGSGYQVGAGLGHGDPRSKEGDPYA